MWSTSVCEGVGTRGPETTAYQCEESQRRVVGGEQHPAAQALRTVVRVAADVLRETVPQMRLATAVLALCLRAVEESGCEGHMQALNVPGLQRRASAPPPMTNYSPGLAWVSIATMAHPAAE